MWIIRFYMHELRFFLLLTSKKLVFVNHDMLLDILIIYNLSFLFESRLFPIMFSIYKRRNLSKMIYVFWHSFFIFIIYPYHDLKIIVKRNELHDCIVIPFYLTLTKGEQNLLDSKFASLHNLKRGKIVHLAHLKRCKILLTFYVQKLIACIL